MSKLSLLALSAVLFAIPAQAERGQPIPGDTDFLAEAYRNAENGTDFSYARTWRGGLAYDGTDTSRYVEQLKQDARPRTDYITRSSDQRPQPKVREAQQPGKLLLRGRQTK